ncbi:glutaredoxin domain-containing cysteine-rich protein CG31559 [Hyalella azteca]|uniref:Glutaredoxin domain-containing cysteine-rich protein CG31559 n=1 Tax=Hyalella azteca TaxID=294128 RepID=A0A8B7PE78_HYAAZ|nr:glutaredoxin domain-containing cysteine-rich protein CG31559 [Hyalella azteca]
MAPVINQRSQPLEVLDNRHVRDNRHKSGGEDRKFLKHTWSDSDSRSISPSPSVKSFHSARSAFSVQSEVGDSGVSSERDSPSPRESPSLNSSIGPSESEDSCGSSESLHKFSAETQKFQEILKNTQQNVPKLPPKNRKRPLHINKPSLPTVLFKQICERARQFEKRRQRAAKIEASSINKMRGLTIRGRPITHTRMTHSQPPHSTLLSTASLFPSTPSLILEEDEGEDERVHGTRSSLSCEDSSLGSVTSSCMAGLFEHEEQDAGVAFAGIRDIFSPQQLSTIRSQKGTVRGVRNRVRAGIATFTSDQRILKLYSERERGRVVMFVTSLGIVRSTYERCQSIRKILWNLMVQFEERDVFMARDTQLQLLDRLNSKVVSLPHIFIEGQYLGGADLIEHLNETGELRRLMQPYRMQSQSKTRCEACGGHRMLPCPVCSGSKKSLHRNHFTLEFVALKCSCCDESGLVPCSECAQNG